MLTLVHVDYFHFVFSLLKKKTKCSACCFSGCSEKNNDKKCNKCRFAKDPDENQCLEECLAPKTLKKNKDCVGKVLSLSPLRKTHGLSIQHCQHILDMFKRL